MNKEKNDVQFVICICNRDSEDLTLRKIYPVATDGLAAEEDYLRVIDDSGEDYLYPADYFVTIHLPPDVVEAVFDAPGVMAA